MPRGKTPEVLARIDACRTILAQIQPAGVRAVCYRLFVQGLLESMAKKCTNRISRDLVYAREQRIVPWEHVVDETRDTERAPAWKDSAAYVRAVRRAYRRDHWNTQPFLVEIISEKNTVKGTLAPILDEYGVSWRPWHGFTSATKARALAVDIRHSRQHMILLYLGDWDPSGLNMSESDAPKRLIKYEAGDGFTLKRIALTRELIDEHRLPGFDVETKKKAQGYKWYRSNQGPRAWELDALNPTILRAVVEAEIRSYIDWDCWQRSLVVEQAEIDSLQHIFDRWTACG
jgi:hypothetical protein